MQRKDGVSRIQRRTIVEKCNHSPDARNICIHCKEPISYLDFGGPGSGGVWITDEEWNQSEEERKSKPVPNVWISKTGKEIIDDFRRVLNSRE